MQTHFKKSCLPDGELPVTVHTANLATIVIGAVDLYVQGPEDADRLIKAAVAAKEGMLAGMLAKREPADWCTAYTGPDDELDRAVYCDRQAGHPGNHRGAVGDGSEIAWPADDEYRITPAGEAAPAVGWEQSADGTQWRHQLPDGRTGVIERLDDGVSFLPKICESREDFETGPVFDGLLAAANWVSEHTAADAFTAAAQAAEQDQTELVWEADPEQPETAASVTA